MQITTSRGFAPTTMGEAIQFSEMLAGSNMVPKAYQGKPMDILVCVQWGMELNLAPMAALQNIAVINGKPSVYGDTMLALVQASAVCEGIEESFEGDGTSNPVAVCVAHRKGRKPVVARFSRVCFARSVPRHSQRAGVSGRGAGLPRGQRCVKKISPETGQPVGHGRPSKRSGADRRGHGRHR